MEGDHGSYFGEAGAVDQVRRDGKDTFPVEPAVAPGVASAACQPCSWLFRHRPAASPPTTRRQSQGHSKINSPGGRAVGIVGDIQLLRGPPGRTAG